MWSYSLGSGGKADVAASVAIDSADNVLVTGSFQDSPGFPARFGGVTVKSTGGKDGYVGKYTSAGAPSWVRRFGGPDDDAGFGVSVDSAGSPHVVGVFTKFAEFDGHPLYGTALFGDAPYQQPTLDSFVMKLAP